MKKYLSISLVFLLAFVITYAGSGINAYSFCCEDCHSYGVEAIVSEKCCDVHHHNDLDEQEKSNTATTCKKSHNQCSIDRLDIDLQDAPTENCQVQKHINQLNIHFTTLLYTLSNPIESNELITAFISQSQRPPHLSERVYFSLLETLII